MKVIKLVLLLFILAGVISCKKNKSTAPIRTILPLPYLPVYPGSYWVYVGNHHDTTYSTTNSSYVLYSYPFQGVMTEPVYVPFSNGRPIYGYATPVADRYGNPNSWIHQILFSDVLGFRFPIVNQDVHINNEPAVQVTAVEQTDTVNGVIYPNVVINTSSIWGSILVGRDHYAKDVGLIKEEGMDSSNHWVTVKTLVRYYINR